MNDISKDHFTTSKIAAHVCFPLQPHPQRNLLETEVIGILSPCGKTKKSQLRTSMLPFFVKGPPAGDPGNTLRLSKTPESQTVIRCIWDESANCFLGRWDFDSKMKTRFLDCFEHWKPSFKLVCTSTHLYFFVLGLYFLYFSTHSYVLDCLHFCIFCNLVHICIFCNF